MNGHPPFVVSLCATCCHAEWEKTARGRRHPRGVGQCRYLPPDGPLPKCRASVYGRNSEPIDTVHRLIYAKAGNAYIYWRDSHRVTPEPCAAWEAK